MVRGDPGGRPRGQGGGRESGCDTDIPTPPPPAVSISVRECEEGQRQGWSNIQQRLSNAKQCIDLANRNAQAGNEKLKKLTEGALWT